MSSYVLAALASVGLVGAGLATAAETRAFEALPMAASSTFLAQADGGGGGGQCRVDVVRNAAPGSAVITRQVVDGACVCTITTGPAGNNGGAEQSVIDLLRDRNCAGAPAAANLDPALTGAAGGGSGVVIGVLVAAGLAGALAVGAGGGDSNG